ncbi:MAG: LexA family transcriptional regulator [Planctomycetes bacterium]|nr:LexA family transcriptional regulator [Planctomycetota bacterium]
MDQAAASHPASGDVIQLPIIRAGWPEAVGVDGVSTSFDPACVLRTKPTSFAFRVRGCSMVGANIYDGDIVIGEFTPEAKPGAIVVALIDGESALKRLVIRHGRPFLVSENPNQPDLSPLSELVIQGVAHTVVHPLR